MSLTGNKETDMLILLDLEDEDLKSFCSVNKQANKICQDPIFWMNKLIRKFSIAPEKVNRLKKYLNLSTKDLYIYIQSFEFPDVAINLFDTDYIEDFIEDDLLASVIPDWINLENLKFHLRKEVAKAIENKEFKDIYMRKTLKKNLFNFVDLEYLDESLPKDIENLYIRKNEELKKNSYWSQEMMEDARKGKYYMRFGETGSNLKLNQAKELWRKDKTYIFIPSLRIFGHRAQILKGFSNLGFSNYQEHVDAAYTPDSILTYMKYPYLAELDTL
jgi:hypothetical protein